MAHGTFEVTRRDTGRLSVLVVRGAIDITRSHRLGSAIHEVLGDGPQQLVLDLCGVELVDSTGLAVLVDARRRALRQGIELRLACDAPRALKVLALTGLDRAFDIYPSSEGAVEACDMG